MSKRKTCEGCGYEYGPDRWAILPTLVNLRDDTQREIHFCDPICCEFWDETDPGDWIALDSGEEVQLADWMCPVCCSVCPCGMMKAVIDTEYDPERETVVCSLCLKKEKERFRTVPELEALEAGLRETAQYVIDPQFLKDEREKILSEFRRFHES